ncbi:MAG: hypothetical protein KIT09_08805 [Bryobacteraceae bacterium]|nr:hypothetical protein [Bryobacteraceae bacterium]
MALQNYENHRRQVAGYSALLLIIAATFVGACVNLYQSLGDHQRLYSASLLVVLSGCVFFAAGYARTFALKAQDRAIRAEENLRHYVMAGSLLDSRLSPRQIVALRFASDQEFVGLARQAAEEGMAPDQIKRAVRDWRADTYRV